MVDKLLRVNDYTAMADIIPHDLWTVRLHFRQTLSGEMPERLSDALEDLAVSVFLHNQEATDGDDWTVTLTTLGKPDLAAIRERAAAIVPLEEKDIVAEKLPEKDWLRHVHDNFPPIRTEKFFIYGSHYEGEKPQGLIPLQIDAATAFGSGEHETTRGCLIALERLKAQGCAFKNGLDMGCGSGILAIAMVKFWPDIRVAAVDIDPESVTVTKRHAEMNDVRLQTEAGDGYRTPLVGKAAPYDIIAANILANPLIEMAPDLMAALAAGGYAVLSGLLQRQKEDVLAAHTALGLEFFHEEKMGDWCALILRKRAG
jgi:ribosomal protein L11 methyltransferase